MAGTGSSPRRIPRGTWTISPEEAQAFVVNARRAFFVMVGALAIIWAIQVANVLDSYHLSQSYGIRPRDIPGLPYILTAPFLHASWTHIEGNSGPLFIFGFLAAYRGIGKFFAVTAVVIVTSGLAAWFFEASNTVGVGASGVVFGYFGYIIVRGIFDRRAVDVVIGAVMALCFAYQFSVLLPHQGIGWQAHVGGVVGGIAAGWLFRDSRAVRTARQSKPASAAAKSSATTTVALPGTQNSPTLPAAQSGKSGKSGKKLTVDPANPRADLYKELDDLGL
ncbi:MAG TPA: rhomboid family intramembrane serine protease [Streptosporangiaceae bacterium]|nr:rhomboid family intramembrane serine protease [Streptosporangiaceae bacterium]